jgi:hypothetical protein
MTHTIQLSKYALAAIFLLLFGTIVFSLVKPPSAQAACYCVDPVGDSCRCTTSAADAGVAGGPNCSTAVGGEEICCDTDFEANTYWSVISPVCGSAVESIPYCSWRYAQEGYQHNDITCWGTQWASDLLPNNVPPSTGGTLEPWGDGNVQFNGYTSDRAPNNIHTCQSNIFCCGSKHFDGTSFCSDDGVPVGTDCSPQNTEVVPPDWCGLHQEGAIPCSKTGDEFHTFRPYPKSPCDPVAHELAPFCGNTLNLSDGFGIEKRWTFTPPNMIAYTYWYSSDTADPNCETDDEGNISCPIPEGVCVPSDREGYEVCTFTIGRRMVEFFIFLEDAFLPIMGNTELVIHHSGMPPLPADTDTLTDAQKVNEYVSWYLNGVTNNPTEYGPILSCTPLGSPCEDNPGNCCQGYCGADPIAMRYQCTLIQGLPTPPPGDDTNKKGINEIINYSGPLRKLLPHRIQRDIASSEIIDGYMSRHENANIRHNQLIGCVRNIAGNLFSPQNWGKIIACYHSAGGKRGVRLATFMDPSDPDNDYLPPKEENFDSAVDWVFEFRVWRGQICFLFNIPGGTDVRVGFCFNNPFAIDAYSELFFHSLLSSTEDRIGLVDVVGAGFRPMPISNNPNEGHRIIDSNVRGLDKPWGDPTKPPFSKLYFAHMQEASELADSLQKTYSAKDEPLVTAVTNVEPPLWCDVREVRSNPGDALFPEPMRGVIEYSSEVDCAFVAYDPDDPNPTGALCILAGAGCVNPADIVGQTCCVDYGSMDCPVGEFCVSDCRSNTWDFTLEPPPYDCGGFNPDGPDFSCQLGCLTCESASWSDNCPNGFQCARNDSCSPDDDATLPVERCDTAVMISLETETKTPKADEVWSRLVAGEKGVFKKIFPKIELGSPIEAIWDIPASSPVTIWSPFLDSVGNPAAGRDVPELYFSHIGGIHQYFLKCIQTALRPQGFGEPCLSGSEISLNSDFGFNIHSLARRSEDEIYNILLAVSECGRPDTIRFWGCDYCHRMTDGFEGIGRVLRVAEQSFPEMRFIIALEDYNTDYGFRGRIGRPDPCDNPIQWYTDNAIDDSYYYDHVERVMAAYGNHPQVLIWELLNEPHCSGWPDCPQPFHNFVKSISNLIADTLGSANGTSKYISPGMMGGHIDWGDYENINNIDAVTANSCHYYSNIGNNISVCFEAANHKGNINFFYVGEAGYHVCSDRCSSRGCSSGEYQTRVNNILADFSSLSSLIDGYIIWDFGVGGCSDMAVFHNDPLCCFPQRSPLRKHAPSPRTPAITYGRCDSSTSKWRVLSRPRTLLKQLLLNSKRRYRKIWHQFCCVTCPKICA